MGRIKTQLIKRISLEIFNWHGDKLKNSFEENKKVVAELANIPSKKIKNVVAGYVTRLMKQHD